jgi:hypothetical protein
MAQHIYISSIRYIDNLRFDYIETYSFQRGAAYEAGLKRDRPEYERLKVRKEKRNDLSQEEKARHSELHSLLATRQYLINESGQFHPTSEKTHRFNADDQVVKRLMDILHTEINNVPAWMCAPHYRDAIVFFDKRGKVISCLNVCLECEYMETKMFNHVDGDSTIYRLLRQFFIDLDHKVEPKF